MEPKTTISSHDDDKEIDFKKLERELHKAVEADARYWRENDAKFRAVNQRVGSYEEFRDIVKAAHLKPLEKEDRLTDMKFTQPWNTQASKKTDEGVKQTSEDIPKDKTYPTTPQAFVREWRRFNKNTSEQCCYLLEIGPERLENIFANEIGFGLLGEFLNCLNAEFKSENCKDISTILDHLKNTKRFSLTVQFLNSKEKKDCVELFQKLEECIEKEVESDEQLRGHINSLKKVYEIR